MIGEQENRPLADASDLAGWHRCCLAIGEHVRCKPGTLFCNDLHQYCSTSGGTECHHVAHQIYERQMENFISWSRQKPKGFSLLQQCIQCAPHRDANQSWSAQLGFISGRARQREQSESGSTTTQFSQHAATALQKTCSNQHLQCSKKQS